MSEREGDDCPDLYEEEDEAVAGRLIPYSIDSILPNTSVPCNCSITLVASATLLNRTKQKHFLIITFCTVATWLKAFDTSASETFAVLNPTMKRVAEAT